MKRAWIACVILVLLLVGTLAHSSHLNRFTRELEQLLTQAEVMAEQGDWTGAEALTEDAYALWSAQDAYLHILLRHNETDEVYAGFREVREFLQCQEGGEYSAANARLLAKIGLLAEAEQPSLKNVL